MVRKKKASEAEAPEVEAKQVTNANGEANGGETPRINKAEIVSRISSITDFHRDDVRVIVGGFTTVVEEALVNGEEALISEFGSFYLAPWKAREGRNPSTGEAIKISERVTPKFKFSKKVVDRVSEANAPLEDVEEEILQEEPELKPKRARRGSKK